MSISGNDPGRGPEDQRIPHDEPDYTERSGLIYCGLCGALNPASAHYCARCGSTLVDAFHATEGLRVFQRPDAAARIVEIVPAGTELEMLPDDDAPADYVRVRLADGRLGYVRVADIDAARMAASRAVAAPATALPEPDINTAARGCITPAAALAAIGLLVLISVLLFVLFARGRSQDQGIIALFFCVTVVPILVILIGLYISSRARDERLEDEAEEA